MPTRIENALTKLKELAPQVEQKIEVLSHPKTPEKLKKDAEDAVNGAGYMEDIMRQRFARQESAGKSWAPTKASTTKQKSKEGQGAEPLERTGALKQGAINAVKGTFRLDKPIVWDIGKIGVRYAKPVNKKRPFFHPPSQDELKPSMDEVSRTVGRGIGEALG